MKLLDSFWKTRFNVLHQINIVLQLSMETTLHRDLILLRGLPGSGKSTLARVLAENGRYPVYAIDDYFTDKNSGAYVFHFRENHLAYKACEDAVYQAMERREPKMFVANTFTMDWEIEPYFKLASAFQYRVFVVTVEKYHNGLNVHEVSDEQIQRMAEKYKVKLF